MKRLVSLNTSPGLSLQNLRKRNDQNDSYKKIIEGTSHRHKHEIVREILENSQRSFCTTQTIFNKKRLTVEGQQLPTLDEETPFEDLAEDFSSARSSRIQKESEANLHDLKKLFARKNAPVQIDGLTGLKVSSHQVGSTLSKHNDVKSDEKTPVKKKKLSSVFINPGSNNKTKIEKSKTPADLEAALKEKKQLKENK